MYNIISDKSSFHAGDVRVAPDTPDSVVITKYYLKNGQLESEDVGRILKSEVEDYKNQSAGKHGGCIWNFFMDILEAMIVEKLGDSYDYDITEAASEMFEMF